MADRTKHTPRKRAVPDRPVPERLLDELERPLAQLDGPKAEEHLQRLGFQDGAAAFDLLIGLLESQNDARRGALGRRLVERLLASADPDLALVHVVRYVEARYGDDVQKGLELPKQWLELLVHVGGYSVFLSDMLVRYPEYLDWLAEQARLDAPRTVEEHLRIYREGLGEQADAERRRIVVRLQRRELLRLTVRRILGFSDEPEMARELSDLAAATLEIALQEVERMLEPMYGRPMEEAADEEIPVTRQAGFSVIAMGKLGGRELNFSSDIDLMFLYSDEGTTTGHSDGRGRLPNHQYFTRVAEELIKFVVTPSEEGVLYRVDTRLRPDGATGMLVRSLTGYEIYYETQAHPWERLALLKARHVAGHPALGHRFEAMSRPLVFNPLLSEGLVKQVHDLKGRIDAEIQRKTGGEREVKRGWGGIREVEFLLQTMQMIHGARFPELCVSNTLGAIDGLNHAGLLSAVEARQMAEDYVFLRTIEHRLQMVHLTQTHKLPDRPGALDALARRCAVTTRDGRRPGEVLIERWRCVAERVHVRFVQFFEPAQQARVEPTDAQSAGNRFKRMARWILSETDERRVAPELTALGFNSPGSALKTLRRLAGLGRSVYLSTEAQSYFDRLLPILLHLCSQVPRPDNALANFESFLNASGALSSFYAIFLQNPALFEMLMMAFGTGNLMARTLIAHPEFTDYLTDARLLGGPPDPQAMRARLRWWTEDARDDERFCSALVRFKRFEHLMAGLGEIACLQDYITSCRRISATADMIVQHALARAAASMGLSGTPSHFAVLALGKLGSGELNHYSDLDLIFVWRPPFGQHKPSAGEFAAALAERVVALLSYTSHEGKAYTVDARLRPEGQNAPLAPPLERYLEYFGSGRAQVWELQAAMKLRPIAGDADLADQMQRQLADRIAQRSRQINPAEAIRSMRKRMETSLKVPRWALCDFKSGPGGTVDIEFVAQYYQLLGLHEDPGLMGRGPLEVFPRLRDAGTMDAQLAGQLCRDYEWLRRLERRARLLYESDRSYLPTGGDRLVALERACKPLLAGLDGELIDVVTALMRRVRERFDELIPAEEATSDESEGT